MNGLEKLKINQEDKNFLKKSATNQMRFLGLEYSILSIEDKSITILVRQKRLINEKVLTKLELIERAKDFLTVPSIESNISIHVRPIVFNVTDSEVVNHFWVQQQMQKNNLQLKHLVEIIGIDKSTLSELVSGKAAFTKWHKAAFYYFFKSFEKG
jgi:hypothetical protein